MIVQLLIDPCSLQSFYQFCGIIHWNGALLTSTIVNVAGHYVALVKSHDNWLFFDDEQVEPIPESVVRTTFGSTQEYSNHMDHGYILMYEMQDAHKSAAANGDS